jgi:flagella basal body P-ring formation protein FlgA
MPFPFKLHTSWMLASALFLFMTAAHAQLSSPNTYPVAKLNVTLRSQCECPSNLLLLSDVAEITGADATVKQLQDAVLGIAPKLGSRQAYSKEAIERTLIQRGIARESIVWQGAKECSVLRIAGHRTATKMESTTTETIGSRVITASAQSAKSESIPMGTRSPGNGSDEAKFVPTNVTPVTIRTAERNVADLIARYLQTMTNSNGQWVVKPTIAPEHAKTLSIAQQIKSIAGGQPPWEGDQEFVMLVKGAMGEQTIPVRANIKLPDMVVAANRPLAKGYILKESDLVWIPMPRGLTYGPEECFATPDAIIGQQLKRSMSMQQVIRHTEVGPPTVIHVGDVITVEVLSGPVVVSTNGRAVEAGSIDDLIQVEIESSRSRVVARVTGPKTAEVIATGGRIASPKNSSASPNRTLTRR